MKSTMVALWLGLAVSVAWAQPAEFCGPFASWANVKTNFGAVGDGKTDDTAAIQKALESVRRKDSPQRVLYFPDGTYRITDTLKLERISHGEPLGMSMAGEDPERTIIRWDGPAGGSMILYDAWFASISRLTLDGAGRAKTAIQHGPAFATANECTDMIVKDVAFGIEAGQRDGIAETAVLRCRFYRCTSAAISIQNFNSLDWYLWDCWFEDCGIGASNEFGAGNFHVYRSTFLRSKDADITIRNTGYFSFLGNTSIGSRRFFHAKRAPAWKDTETWGSQATLQDNRILDPTDLTPIVIENNGPNLLLDNTICAQSGGPLVVNTPPAEQADLIAVGNTWTSDHPIRMTGRLTDLDNRCVKAAACADAAPAPVPFAVHAVRPVIEVVAGADSAAIQLALDQAAAKCGQRPVVHLPKGDYVLRNTLVIPAGSDLQMVGDGPEQATQLTSAGVDPLIRIEGPSHATLRNLLVNAGREAVGILVEKGDQPGGRIFGEQLNVTGFEYGLVIDGLKRTGVELHDAGHNGLQVVGGGGGKQPWVALFAGASTRDSQQQEGIHLYDVQNGGRLLVRDIWYEGQAWSLMHLAGCGDFAYHCGFVAPADPSHLDPSLAWERELRASVAALQFDGFTGKVAFTLVSADGATLRVAPPSAGLELYLLGFLSNRSLDYGGAAVKGQVVAEHMKAFRPDRSGLDSVAGINHAEPAFIRKMLTPLRTVKPQHLDPRPDGVTDLRFHRVWATGRNGVHVKGR